uniref:Ig-like domain-containing protein n=1 Tax=Heterorhabditis bacteriophora TaxID=37862 RepID=A0A1I7WH53_HETBA
MSSVFTFILIEHILEALCRIDFIFTLVYFEPRIVISPSSNPVQKPAGQQVSLLCTVERLNASSRPGILWTKHGGIDSRTGNIEVKKLDAFTMSLVISNTSSEDSGVYTCQVQYGEHLLQKNVDNLSCDFLSRFYCFDVARTIQLAAEENKENTKEEEPLNKENEKLIGLEGKEKHTDDDDEYDEEILP